MRAGEGREHQRKSIVIASSFSSQPDGLIEFHVRVMFEMVKVQVETVGARLNAGMHGRGLSDVTVWSAAVALVTLGLALATWTSKAPFSHRKLSVR